LGQVINLDSGRNNCGFEKHAKLLARTKPSLADYIRHCIRVILSILGAILVAEEWALRLVYPGIQDTLVSGNTVYQISNTHPAWLGFFGILFIYSLVFLIVLSFFYVRRHPTKAQELLQQRTKALQEELQGLVIATDKIASRLYQGGKEPERKFPMVEETFTILPGGDLYAHRLFHIKAVKGNLRFWEFGFGPDAKGTPLELVSQLKFTAKDVSGNGEVVYLISNNEPTYKKIVLFFLPAIKPIEESPREILVTYHWPGFWSKLLNDKQEPSEFGMKSSVGRFQRTYKIAPGMGNLKVSRVSKLDGDS